MYFLKDYLGKNVMFERPCWLFLQKRIIVSPFDLVELKRFFLVAILSRATLKESFIYNLGILEKKLKYLLNVCLAIIKVGGIIRIFYVFMFFSRREVLNFNFIFIFCLLSSNIINVQKKQKEDITCLRIWAICMIDCPFFLGYILLRIFFRLWAPRLRQKYVYKKEKQKNVPHLEKLDKSRHD